MGTRQKLEEAIEVLKDAADYLDYALATRTPHQQRVDKFMVLAGQDIPDQPTVPSQKIRGLRARLILEECLETIDALGFCAGVTIQEENHINPVLIPHNRGPNLIEIADGCADISVVTVGTLSACGISDKALLAEVDLSNLAKFETPKCPTHNPELTRHEANGQYVCTGGRIDYPCEWTGAGPYRRADGKWIKGPHWKAPDIAGILAEQSLNEQLPPAPANPAPNPAPIESARDYIDRMIRRNGAKSAHCHHCRGILSEKLVSNIIEHQQNDYKSAFQCPNCMKVLELEQIIYS